MRILILTMLLTLMPLFAYGEGYISATYAYNPVDALVGADGSYSKDFGNWELQTDASIQAGDIVEGDAHVSALFDAWKVQVKPFAELTGVKMDDVGGTIDGGVALNVPIGSVDVAVGGFLRGSNAFIPLQTGTRNPVTGVETWTDPSILNFADLGLVNALLETKWKWKRLDIGLTGIVDVSNQAWHQLIIDLGASWDLPYGLALSVSAEQIFQAGTGGGQQFDLASAIGYTF